MNRNTKYIVICVGFAIASILMFGIVGLNQVNERQVVRNIFDEYYSNVDYYLSGKIINKTLIQDCGSEFRDLYLIEVDVDSLSITENNLQQENPFWGVYNKKKNRVYFISSIYNIDNKIPTSIEVSSEKREIKFSNGFELGMIVSNKFKELTDLASIDCIKFWVVFYIC